MRLVWAEAVGLAVLLLLWAGYGEAAWARAGLRSRRVLAGGFAVWAAGSILVRGVDVGLLLLTACAGARLWGRGSAMGRAALWGLVAAAGRAYAPIDPYQATVVPAVGIEAVLLGVAAAVGAADPPTAGAVAVGAAALAEGLRWMWAGAGTAGLGPTAWLYAVTAGVVAFCVSAGRAGIRVSGRSAP